MELPSFIRTFAKPGTEIKTIEMHTTGEPTRIVYAGYPDLTGTLLEQRAEAQKHHEYIRRQLIYEPRGHREMYGAVLRLRTELVESEQAHMGVLFLTNDGYSTMCGHATLAVARLLVDQAGAGSDEFISQAGRKKLEVDPERNEVKVDLHVPCGLVHVTVPIVSELGSSGRWRTDTTRPISYLSVPSYATGIWVTVGIPPHLSWPELGERDSVVVDIAYGGAFYIISSPAALGFSNSLAKPDLAGLSTATRRLKEAFNSSEQLRKFYLRNADGSTDLDFLYGTIVTDAYLGVAEPGTNGAETSICFFSNAQIDRSPTGSGVQAKVALAYAKGRRRLHEKWTYHSLVSNQYSPAHGDETPKGVTWNEDSSHSEIQPASAQQVNGVDESTEQLERNGSGVPSDLTNGIKTSAERQPGEGAFIGEAVEEVSIGGKQAVIVRVSGWARYTGVSAFVVEDGDGIGEGFWFEGD